MVFELDHVTYAATTLSRLVDAFTGAGLAPDYGGPHGNGITHMSLLGFDDGSYIELISTLEPGAKAPLWDRHIRTDGGPCAWAVQTKDIAGEVERLAAHLSVAGPKPVQRVRPDGTTVAWELAFVGDEGPGALHPFLIQDRTPRSYRVSVSGSVAATELAGVAMVIVAVADPDAAIDVLRSIYGLDAPEIIECAALDAPLRCFPGEPLALTGPSRDAGWLAERFDRYGPSPCAFLLGTRDMKASRARFPLRDDGRWLGRALAWIDTPGLRDLHLGLVEVPS